MAEEPKQGEEQKDWDLWLKSRDPEAGNALVKRYMPLVSFHVQRIAAGLPRNVSKEDLKSLGMFGLLDSLNKFDPSRELRFDTYASFRIRGAILDGLRKEDWLSRGTREKAKKIESAIESLEQKYLRTVSPKEVALELGMEETEVCTTMNEQFFANVLSIEETGTDNDEPEAASRFVSGDRNAGQPESELEKKGNRKGTGGGHPCPVGKRAACAEPLLSGRMHADRNRRSDGAFHFPDFPDPFEGHLQTAEYFGKTAAVIRGGESNGYFFPHSFFPI